MVFIMGIICSVSALVSWFLSWVLSAVWGCCGSSSFPPTAAVLPLCLSVADIVFSGVGGGGGRVFVFPFAKQRYVLAQLTQARLPV